MIGECEYVLQTLQMMFSRQGAQEDLLRTPGNGGCLGERQNKPICTTIESKGWLKGKY